MRLQGLSRVEPRSGCSSARGRSPSSPRRRSPAAVHARAHLGVLYVFAVLTVAVFWWSELAAVVSVASCSSFNWFSFRRHIATARRRDWAVLAVYLVTAVVVIALAARARRRRRARGARRARGVTCSRGWPRTCWREPSSPTSRAGSACSPRVRSTFVSADRGRRRSPPGGRGCGIPSQAQASGVSRRCSSDPSIHRPGRRAPVPAGARVSARRRGRSGIDLAAEPSRRRHSVAATRQDRVAPRGVARPPSRSPPSSPQHGGARQSGRGRRRRTLRARRHDPGGGCASRPGRRQSARRVAAPRRRTRGPTPSCGRSTVS